MGNPAELLLEQFKTWSKPNTAPAASRGLNTGTRLEILAAHVEAMGHIKVLTEFVDALDQKGEPVDRYRRAIPMWTSAVLAYPQGWSDQTTNQKLFTSHMLDVLEGLAVDINRLLPGLTVDERDTAWRILDEIADLLDASEDELDVRLRGYIHQLLQHIRDCLEDFSTHGAFDLRHALMRLWVATQAAENSASDETKQRWASFREKIWPAAAGGFLGSLPQLTVAVAQLTQSGG